MKRLVEVHKSIQTKIKLNKGPFCKRKTEGNYLFYAFRDFVIIVYEFD